MTDVPVFTIARTFDAPIEQVFDAWADQQKMAQWSGPPGAVVTPLTGEIAPGSLMHSRSDHPDMGAMYTLALWREVTPPTRISWEQSFADEAGNKIRPGFFPAWPLTLLTEVDFEAKGDATLVKLKWTPIEGTEEDIAEFARQMGSMEMGWGGSFDKLAEFLSVG